MTTLRPFELLPSLARGRKVAVGSLMFETNSFSPGVTGLSDFQRHTFVEGPDVLSSGVGRDSIGGAAQIALQEGIDLIPTTSARRPAGPPVENDVCKLLVDRLVTSLAPLVGEIDGLYLSLHGAMVSQSCEDVEGYVLTVVRSMFGSRTPVAISLDLHAHFTAEMAQATDLVAGYQTCPHTDIYQTGQRAMRLLVAAMNGAFPTLRHRKIPVISSSEGHDTNTGPISEVMGRLHEIENEPGVLDASIFLTQPWLDVTELGWSTVVITDGEAEKAQGYSDELAEMLWERRQRVIYKKSRIGDVLDRVRASPAHERPFVLADCADSTSGGSPGDGVALLHSLLAEPFPESVYLTVTSPAAVEVCFEAGVGAELTLEVGGELATSFFRPAEVSGRVVTLCDGRYQGRYFTGPTYVGRTAVLRSGTFSIVITEYPATMLDYELYRRVGLDPTEAKIVQVKSAGGYRAYYGPIAWAMIDLDTKGPTGSDLTELPFTRPRRPLWPFDEDTRPPW